MKQPINLAAICSEYLRFRNSQQSLQIATISVEGLPEASYAPFVWFEDACYLFLSQLARHTQNLNSNAAIGLLLIEDEAAAANQFARRRIIFQGKSSIVARHVELYQTVMQQFRNRFGHFIDTIEPLQDFQLFKVVPLSGRFIRGFAQAFELSGDGLNKIMPVNPAQNSTR